MSDSSRAEAMEGKLRGEALIDEVIEALKAQGNPSRYFGKEGPIPISAEAAAKLTFSRGRPAPASLRRWLAYSAKSMKLVQDIKYPSLYTAPLWELLDEALGGWGSAFETEFGELFPGDCLLFAGSGEDRDFLYLGEPDALGEYPIFNASTDDIPTVSLVAPGFDVYVAQRYGFTSFGDDLFAHPLLGPSMLHHAIRNFHGYRVVDGPGAFTEAAPGATPTLVVGKKKKKPKPAKKKKG